MPSLRVRNERKSYSNIAEGLEQLDDSDIEEGAKDEFVGGSPSSVIIDIDAPNSDDDESLSSGSSSEFRPDGPPAERDSRPLVEEEDEDDDAISEDHVSDEDSPPAPEELKVEDEDPPIMPITREKLPNKPTHPKSQVHVPSRKAAPPTYLQTDTNLLLPAYREIIRTSSHSLAKNIPSNEDGEVTKKGEAERDKYRQLGMEVYPIGPVTPFVTRLTTPPEPGGGGVKWVEGESDVRERREARQKRGYAITRTVPGSSPWETWEGEGWWPEMFNEGFQGGEGRMPGWKLREEVRLGFDDVGRASLDDLQFLSKR
jgi:transcription factor C subunit 6